MLFLLRKRAFVNRAGKCKNWAEGGIMKNYLFLNATGNDFDFLFSNLIRLGCKRKHAIITPRWLKNSIVLFCPTKRKNIISRFLNKQPILGSNFFINIVKKQNNSRLIFQRGRNKNV